MSKAKKGSNGTMVPQGGIAEMCSKMDFWGELTADEQKTVLTETEGLYGALAGIRRLRLGAARHVARVRAVLEGKGHFVKYLHSLDQSSRSSYRWFNRLEEMGLPEPVLDAAERRGVDLIQASYVEAVKALPPPKTVDADTADKYLDRMLKERARMAQDGPEGAGRYVEDPTEAERTAYRAVVGRYKRIPPRAKKDWGLRLLSHLMWALGLPGQRLDPEPAPEDFQPGKPGRWPKE